MREEGKDAAGQAVFPQAGVLATYEACSFEGRPSLPLRWSSSRPSLFLALMRIQAQCPHLGVAVSWGGGGGAWLPGRAFGRLLDKSGIRGRGLGAEALMHGAREAWKPELCPLPTFGREPSCSFSPCCSLVWVSASKQSDLGPPSFMETHP